MTAKERLCKLSPPAWERWRIHTLPCPSRHFLPNGKVPPPRFVLLSPGRLHRLPHWGSPAMRRASPVFDCLHHLGTGQRTLDAWYSSGLSAEWLFSSILWLSPLVITSPRRVPDESQCLECLESGNVCITQCHHWSTRQIPAICPSLLLSV